MTALHVRAYLSLAVLVLIMGLLLFICAGTVRYWHAWIYLLTRELPGYADYQQRVNYRLVPFIW